MLSGTQGALFDLDPALAAAAGLVAGAHIQRLQHQALPRSPGTCSWLHCRGPHVARVQATLASSLQARAGPHCTLQ